MLTGVRGVGKTTTARIIAKALNYKGPDGKSGPTTGSTDDCSLCRAIAEDRHPDVIEMDAASHTGVENMREILDGVRYAPTEARYKIYVIDEVHMLSKSAFNALLKTLEEPPPHVKFIFATTEIRKVPLTVLSRCQRFDLRRVDIPTLSDHFLNICKKEKVKAEDEAIAQIARAADGSVRDGLSLLDQAISLGGEKITAQLVTDMLGLGDRGRTLDLLEKALTGDMPEALKIMDEMYRSGGDPLVLIQDLLDFTHLLTKLRAIPKAKTEDKRLAALAAELSMPHWAAHGKFCLKV
jgi:DNA polymerase-3 subunit gamma/tau